MVTFTIVGRRQVGASRARAKQVPVVGCLPGPISIFFMVWNSLHTCNRGKAAVMLSLRPLLKTLEGNLCEGFLWVRQR
jgi:hypothetical protein